MQELAGERVLMRIHLSEGDKYEGKPLSETILSLLRKNHLAGATLFRGAMSFGANSTLHSDRIEVMSLDLPLVVECVETEENIRKLLPELDRMIGGGLITLERANVVLYRSGSAGDQHEA
jgi:PII-like signaling protein